MSAQLDKPHHPPYQAPLVLATGLLTAQSLALLLTVSFVALRLQPNIIALGEFSTAIGLPADIVLDILLFVAAYGLLAVIGLILAVALGFRRATAWLLAMMQQAGVLGVALYFHFALRDSLVTSWGIIYFIMASSIVVVLYLNTADLRLAFRAVTSAGAATHPSTGGGGAQ